MHWRDEWWIHTPRDFEWRYDPPDIQAGAASASEIHWRFRVDDQSDPDNGTNWHAAEDTNASGVNAIDVDTDFIVRFKIDETETKDWDPGANGLTMQYRHVEGANTWVTIDPTTDNVVRASSGTGGSPTLTNDSTVDTERLTSGTGAYVSGGASTDGTLSTTITKGDYTEVEFCVFVRGTEVTDADTIDFRLQSAGATLVNLGTPPQIEVNKTAVDPVWDQDSFRVGNDDGSESAYNFKRNVNTNWTQRVDARHLIRFLVQETAGATASPTLTLQLQYNKNSGGWNDVTGASSNVRAEASANLTEGGDTTQRIGAGTFLTNNNWVDDNDGLTAASGAFAGNDEAEAVFAIYVVAADVADDDSIQLRVIESPSTPLDSYTNTPTLTVTKQTEEPNDQLTLSENFSRDVVNDRILSDSLTSRQNLVKHSEQFDHADWPDDGTGNVTPNDLASPFDLGSNATADKLEKDSARSTSAARVYQTGTHGENEDYSWSVYARADEATWIALSMRKADDSTYYTWFNLSAGTIGVDNLNGIIQDIGGGWYRCGVTLNTGAGAGVQRVATIHLAQNDGTASITLLNDNDGAHLWGAQLVKGPTWGYDKLPPYVQTTTAAVTQAGSGENLDRDAVNARSLLDSLTFTENFTYSKTALQIAKIIVKRLFWR